MRLYFYLDDEEDEALIAWWLSHEKGKRSHVMRQMMRWYSGQEGFGALIAEIRQIGQLPRPTPTQSAPSLPQPPKDMAAIMDDAISQLFGDEENED